VAVLDQCQWWSCWEALTCGAAQVIAEAPKPVLQESKSMWGRNRKAVVPAKQLTSVIDGLKEVYFNKVRPTGRPVCA